MDLFQRLLLVVGCLSLMSLGGCGGSTPQPESGGGVGGALTNQAAPRPSADDRLKKALSLASVHLKYKEYDQAEKILLDAIADPSASNTTEAVALLDSVKAARRESPASAKAVPAVADAELKPVATEHPPAPPTTSEGETTVAATPAPKEAASSPKPEAPVTQPAAPETAKRAPTEKQPEVIVVEAKPDPVAAEKVPATDASVAELEEKARSQYEATVALKMYERFVEHYTLTPEQQKRLDARFQKWKDLAKDGLVRSGAQWITAEAAQKLVEQADSLIEQAAELVKVQNFKEARDVLLKASRIDQNGIRADFLLGLLNSGVGVNHPETAEEHFRKVLSRSPRHVSALNNLALTEIKLQKYPQALTHFQQAVEQASRTPEINQNLGRLIKVASEKKVIVPATQLTKFSNLYAELTVAGKVKPSSPTVGWLYMPLYLSENERKGRAAAAASGALVLYGSGTGFVVHPGYLLTNRHVVRSDDFGSAEAVKIVDPADEKHERELPATVVAVSADYDLALVKCDSLNVPAVALSTEVPRRGTEVMVLGYPQVNVIGRGIKATRGIVTALPEAVNESMLLFDAEVNGGNSGGPVLDKTGAAVAIATVRYNAARVGNYSGGLPATKAIPFVKTIVPDFASHPAAVEKSWPDVDEQVSPSTVMLLSYYKSISLNLNQASKGDALKGRRSVLEDVSCVVCDGETTIRCTNKGCVKGSVQQKETSQQAVGVGGSNNVTANKVRFITTPCPVCNGKGTVDCTQCTTGRDPALRAR